MLTHLHVKNLALIHEVEIDFTKGLNILTGETGAGKSIIIGSVSLALGGKVFREILREGAEYGLVELVFQVEREEQRRRLLELGVDLEEDQLILSRKITDSRSLNKINGETVTAGQLREVSSVLIDIHGQHEHQSLLQKKKHLEILDEFAKKELAPVKEQIAGVYGTYKKLEQELSKACMDEESRLREISLLEFECREIEEANLTLGEDEDLEFRYRKMSNGWKILESAGTVRNFTGYEEPEAAGGSIGRALRELTSVLSYDEGLEGLTSQLTEIDSLLSDFNRDLSEYLSSLEFSEEEFREVEERLNLLNHLKSKYGRTMADILAYGKRQQERLETLQDYDAYLERLQREVQEAEECLKALCAQATQIRERYGRKLCARIKEHLIDLNFLDVAFELKLSPLPGYTAGGADDAEFLISTNPGESLRPMMKVASGGELSRIMLAIKTVLADRDDIDTVIFDEIDVGISGRTAQKVSEKMMLIGKNRQVICITHLAQIAAMADSHYRIEKNVKNQETRTEIRRLTGEESVEELARILGGAEITAAVMENAREMKKLAEAQKTAIPKNC